MTFTNKLTQKAHIFTAILLILQPVLDIISYWFSEWGLPASITLVLRLGVLAVTVIYAFLITDKKNVYYIAAAVIALIYIGHLAACIHAGMNDIVSDFSNYIRVVQTPLSVICLITLLRKNKNSFEYMNLGLTIAFLIMIWVMLFSTVTGTDPHTYKDGKGVLGWFNNTNSQSSNLCVLLPISLGWQLTWKKFKTVRNQVLFWATCISGLLSMYVFCTRLAYLGIIATTVGMAITLLFIRRDWLTSIILLALAALFIVLIPKSPMMRHINNDYEYLNNTVQSWADSKVEDADKVEELKEEQETAEEKEEKPPVELVDQLRSLYEWKMADFVQIFGLEKTMEMYDYTTDVNRFSDLRAKKITFGKMLMDDSPFTARLFGLELSRFTVVTEQEVVVAEGQTEMQKVTNIYDVENDFHGIYFLYGWVGLIAYVAFILYFVYLIIKALLKSFEQYFTVEAAGFGIAFLLCMVHAYTTAGVLRRPNASIFLAATLAGIYYLVSIRGNIDPKITFKTKR